MILLWLFVSVCYMIWLVVGGAGKMLVSLLWLLFTLLLAGCAMLFKEQGITVLVCAAEQYNNIHFSSDSIFHSIGCVFHIRHYSAHKAKLHIFKEICKCLE